MNLLADLGQHRSPYLINKCRKWGRRGSPQADTLCTRSHSLYGPFGRLFHSISVNCHTILIGNHRFPGFGGLGTKNKLKAVFAC